MITIQMLANFPSTSTTNLSSDFKHYSRLTEVEHFHVFHENPDSNFNSLLKTFVSNELAEAGLQIHHPVFKV
jgi:hypothetical protein